MAVMCAGTDHATEYTDDPEEWRQYKYVEDEMTGRKVFHLTCNLMAGGFFDSMSTVLMYEFTQWPDVRMNPACDLPCL